jgi:hypothetical protein
MNRIIGMVGALVVALLLMVPVALAADPGTRNDHMLVSVGGNLTLAPDESAGTLLVVRGSATVEGRVENLVVVDAQVTTRGATIGNAVLVSGTLDLGSGSVVAHDVQTIGGTVNQAADAQVVGKVGSLESDWLGVGAAFTALWAVFYFGFILAAIAFALLAAGLGARQVRAAGDLISNEPGLAIVSAIVGLVVIPTLAVLAVITVVGAPFGLAIMLGVFPILVFTGYIVTAIWIGDRIIERTSSWPVRERPYLAAVIGIAILSVVGIIPFVGALIGLIGFGAVILLIWRTLAGRSALPATAVAATQPG